MNWAYCCNPTLKECEDDTHTSEMGTWESSGTPENSEFDFRGQNTLPWGVLYAVGKVLKHRCRKWPCMSHSDIFSTSYVEKKGWESNWQFDSRPRCVQVECDKPLRSSQRELQVCFRPHPNQRSEQGVTSCQNPKNPNWDNFETPPWEGLGFRVSGLLLGSLGKKCHLDVGAAE